MSTPDLWAAATAALRDVGGAQTAWNEAPSPETGRTLHQALTRAAAAVHALYHPKQRRPTETGCAQHPHGPVDLAGVDSGEGPCLSCNVAKRRAVWESGPRPQLPRRRPGGSIPRPRTGEDPQ